MGIDKHKIGIKARPDNHYLMYDDFIISYKLYHEAVCGGLGCH